jgi:hypothetical protein
VTEGARTAKRRACSTMCCPGGGAAGPGPDTAAPARRRGRTCRGPGVLDLFAGAVIGPSGQLVEEGADDRTCSGPMPPRAWAGGGDGRLRRQRLTGDGLAWPSCAASSRRRRASRCSASWWPTWCRPAPWGRPRRPVARSARTRPCFERSCDTPTKPLAEAGIPERAQNADKSRRVAHKRTLAGTGRPGMSATAHQRHGPQWRR